MRHLDGKLYHMNCPQWDGEDFPIFHNNKCSACQVDISGTKPVPTYQLDDGVFYSFEIEIDTYVEVAVNARKGDIPEAFPEKEDIA